MGNRKKPEKTGNIPTTPTGNVRPSHHAEGLVNPKVHAQKKVNDFGYPRACRFRKHQIINRSPELTRPTFFKT
jgi:hypothetical protein